MRSWFRGLWRTVPKSNLRRRQRALPPSLERLEERYLLSFNTTTNVAGPNIDASNLSGYQGETTIAINPTNSMNMIAGSNNLGSGGITEAYWTKDGGSTWHHVNLSQNGDPGVAFDRAGNAYFSFINNNLGIGIRKSTDGGKTWGAAVKVAGNHGFGIQDKPAIAIGPDALDNTKDRIYVAWDDNSAGDVVKVSSSGDGGATWTAPKKISGKVNEFFTAPAVGPTGQFYLAWTDFGTAGQSTILFSSSTDNGTTFTTPIVAATSTINTFNPSRYTIPAQNSRGISPNPGLAVEESGSNAGRIYLVYCTAKPGKHSDTDVELIASDDGGATWTALGANPVKVNDDTGSASQFFPAMAIDQTNGTVDISWYDTRNDSTKKTVDVYFQDFSSAGVPNGSNVKVTTAMSDESNSSTNNPNQFGDYTGIAATGGMAFPVWTDHRNNVSGGEEIFVDPPLPVTQTSIASPLTTGATASDLRRGDGMQPTAASVAAPLLVAAGVGSPVAVALPAAPVAVSARAVSLAPHVADVVVPPARPVLGGQQSGESRDALSPAAPGFRGEELAPTPALADEVVEAMASAPIGVGDQGAVTVSKQAGENYFASDLGTGGSVGGDLIPAAPLEHAGTAVESALAALSVAFVFNGFGGARDDKSEPRVPRRRPR
jgi:hypothetical protein